MIISCAKVGNEENRRVSDSVNLLFFSVNFIKRMPLKELLIHIN